MKTFTIAFLTASLALSGTAVFAQQKHIERTYGYDREIFQSVGSSVAGLNDSTWITAGWSGPCTGVFISAYNKDNSVGWQNTLFDPNNHTEREASYINDIQAISPSNEIIAVGEYGYGGDVIDDVGSFIAKLDHAGKLLWQTYYSKDTFRENIGLKGIALATDGSIYAYNANAGIVKTDVDGNRLWQKKFGSDTLFAIAPTGDNGLMLAGKTSLVKIDKDGNVIWTKPLQKTPVKILRLSTGNFAALTSQAIVIVDSAGTVVNDAGFGNAYSKVTSFTTDGNNNFYIAATRASDGRDVILGFNSSTKTMNWVKSFQPDIAIRQIAIKDTMLAITGTENSAKDTNFAWGYAGTSSFRSFIKTLDINGNTREPGNDAGITRIIPGSNITTKKGIKLDTVQLYHVSTEVDVVIRNFGTTVLDSVSVISLSKYGWFCAGATQYKSFNDLALQPGDSVRVTLGNISLSDQNLNQPVEFKFAVNTVSPNGMLDNDPTNDVLNVSFTRTITNINEQAFANTEIKVFPNPATDAVTISSVTPLNADITLVNTLGQIVQRAKLQNEVHLQLDIAALHAGVYMLRISNGSGNIYRNIIKN